MQVHVVSPPATNTSVARD